MIDRRSLLALGAALPAAALPLGGCATSRAGGGDALRVVTYNIWHDMGDWPARRPLLIDALRGADADVIALQEVLEDADKALPNQARTIADALGGYDVRFVSTDAEGGRRRYGNAILSRLPVLAEDRRMLDPRDDFRTALRVRLRTGRGPVDVIGTHLAAPGDAVPVRTRQIADLISWLPADGTPRLLMGDFNAPLEEPSLAPLAAAGFDTALPPGAAAATLVTALGHSSRVIDHIFVDRAAFRVADATVIGDRPTGETWPSDHLGVAATIVRR